eukprot:1157076-Pelagomonas_calceolata.AAC.7
MGRWPLCLPGVLGWQPFKFQGTAFARSCLWLSTCPKMFVGVFCFPFFLQAPVLALALRSEYLHRANKPVSYSCICNVLKHPHSDETLCQSPAAASCSKDLHWLRGPVSKSPVAASCS